MPKREFVGTVGVGHVSMHHILRGLLCYDEPQSNMITYAVQIRFPYENLLILSLVYQ